MAEPRIIIPDKLRDFLEVENCSDFNLNRYYVTEDVKQLYKSILRMRKLTKEMHRMKIDYLNTVLLYGLPGTGKAQPFTAQVLTPSGIRHMGNIKVHDHVLTPTGDKAMVTGVFPQGKQPVYEIRLKSGRTCQCAQDHLWKCKVYYPGKDPVDELLPLDKILEQMYTKTASFKIPVYDNGKIIYEEMIDCNYHGQEPCQCIYIDHPDHLYITDDRIVTHNTYLSKYIANQLDLDFVYISFAKMMGGYGNANKHISDVFRFMASQECVFMLDEIDCIARKRTAEGGDTSLTMSANTITVMQELDYYKSHDVKCVIMAATNREDTLDAALLSRFAIKHEMQPLNNLEKEQYLMNYLKDIEVPFRERDVQLYCSQNAHLEQRNMEMDLIQSVAYWISHGKKGDVQLKHIK